MSGRAEGERKEGDDTWGRAVSGRRASRLAGQACQPREGTLAGRRGSRPARAERGGGRALGRATGLLARECGPCGGGRGVNWARGVEVAGPLGSVGLVD